MPFNMKKTFLCGMLIFASYNVLADSDPKYTAEGSIPLEGISSPDSGYKENVRLEAAEILLTDKLAKNITASIKFKLDRDLMTEGSPLPQDFNVEDFIKSAQIEIRNIGGKPVAIVLGKHEVAYGFDNTLMPVPKESPVHELGVHNEVIGFTVALDTNFQLFDKVEASVFETNAGDMKIGTIDGYAVRFNKDISEQIQIKASAMHLGNGDNPELGVENRQDIGIIIKTKNGKTTFWNENVHFDNNPDYRNSHLAVSTGLSRSFGPGHVLMDATLIPESLKRVGIGYSLNLSKNIIAGAQVNYTRFNSSMEQKNGVQYGVSLKYVFDKKSKDNEADYFFKKKK